MLDKLFTMTTKFYKINKSIGKYNAFRSDDLVNTGICGEVNDLGINPYYDGTFEANIYQNGELTDFELNGWTFSFHFKGNYHEPGTFYDTSVEIECLDPNKNELLLYSTPHKIRFSEEVVLCKYLEMINIYSHFEDADTALKFNYLSRSLEGTVGGRGRHLMNLTYGDILDIILFFRNYYNNLGEDSDRLFLKEIQETVNGALDYLKKWLNLDKIGK